MPPPRRPPSPPTPISSQLPSRRSNSRLRRRLRRINKLRQRRQPLRGRRRMQPQRTTAILTALLLKVRLSNSKSAPLHGNEMKTLAVSPIFCWLFCVCLGFALHHFHFVFSSMDAWTPGTQCQWTVSRRPLADIYNLWLIFIFIFIRLCAGADVGAVFSNVSSNVHSSGFI